MARITVFTAARMAAIEAASIVGGAINGSGRLILSRNDGTTLDAGAVLGSVPAASSTVAGLIELADTTEVQAMTASDRAVTPANMASVAATNADVSNGTSTTRFVTAASLVSRIASATVVGLVRLATNAEAQAGSLSTVAVTPANLGSIIGVSTPRGVVYISKGVGSTNYAALTETIAMRCTGISLVAGRHYKVQFVYGTIDTDAGNGTTYNAGSGADIQLRLSAVGGSAGLTDTIVAFMRTASFGDAAGRGTGGEVFGTFTVATTGMYSIAVTLKAGDSTIGNRHRFLNANVLTVEDLGPSITESASVQVLT